MIITLVDNMRKLFILTHDTNIGKAKRTLPPSKTVGFYVKLKRDFTNTPRLQKPRHPLLRSGHANVIYRRNVRGNAQTEMTI
jgi:hypothetical protein